MYSDNQSQNVKDVASIVYNMWEPLRNHPIKGAGALVAGMLAGVGTGLASKNPWLASAVYNSVFSGIIYGTDTYDQSLAEQVNDIQEKNPNIKTADITNDPNIKRTAVTSAILETGADTVLLGTGKVLKPVAKVGSHVLTKALSKVQKDIAKIATPTVGKIATTEVQKQTANATKNALWEPALHPKKL